MKKQTFRLWAIAFICALAFTSCATKKKYGCPEHISLKPLVGLIR
jgi:hypothetical protein